MCHPVYTPAHTPALSPCIIQFSYVISLVQKPNLILSSPAMTCSQVSTVICKKEEQNNEGIYKHLLPFASLSKHPPPTFHPPRSFPSPKSTHTKPTFPKLSLPLHPHPTLNPLPHPPLRPPPLPLLLLPLLRLQLQCPSKSPLNPSHIFQFSVQTPSFI